MKYIGSIIRDLDLTTKEYITNNFEVKFTKNTAFNKNFSTTATDIKMNGIQSLGQLTTLARADHVHPVDTSRAAASHTHGTYDNSTALTGANVYSNISVTDGIVTGLTTRALTAANIGAAPTSHSHGNILSGGTITAAAVTPANTDYLLISDTSASGKIARGVAIGTSTSTYLRNDGTWGTPPNTTYTASSFDIKDLKDSTNLRTTWSGKLDASSYTASDVLTKIKTVDGSGSGLDADLLDGQNGSYYTTTSNLMEPAYVRSSTTKTSRPLFDVLRADRTAFLPATQIIIEQSTDAGVTWTDAGVSDTNKAKLFTGQRPSISIPLKGGVKSTDCMIRVTITGMRYNQTSATGETDRYNYWNSTYVQSTERYFAATDGWVWLSSNSDRIYMKAERATGESPNTWHIDREAYMSGWSGGNYFSLSGSNFGGGTTQTSNYWNWRFTFRTCSSMHTFNDADLAETYTTSAQVINHIKINGQNVWSYSNNYMYHDHLYNWDESQNAFFPAQVSGTVLKSTIPTGTSPLTVISTTVVPNLNADLLDGNHASAFALASQVLTDVPLNAKFTDTVTSINGKTGVITKADIVALGIPAQDTNTTYTASSFDIKDLKDSTNLRTTWSSKADANHNHTLDSLSNVTITANATGEILKWNGTAWVNNTLAEAGISAVGHTHSYDNYGSWTIKDGDTTTYAITSGDVLQIVSGTGISSNFTAKNVLTITNTAPNVTTNISITHNANNISVNSSDGTNGTVNAATTSLAGVMTSTDKTKLDGIATGAEVNQNAFSNIAVSGQTTVAADAKTDTLTLIAGNNIAITTNATNDSVTISNISLYATCATAAATAAKTASMTGFKLYTGAVVYIKFTYANTAANPTLNINSTGAKPLTIGGVAMVSGHLVANRVYAFIYDGTNYEPIFAPTVWE